MSVLLGKENFFNHSGQCRRWSEIRAIMDNSDAKAVANIVSATIVHYMQSDLSSLLATAFSKCHCPGKAWSEKNASKLLLRIRN